MEREAYWVTVGRRHAQEMKKWRKKRRITQKAFARALGCSPITISFYEKGKYPVVYRIYRQFEALKRRYREAKLGN